MKKLFSLVMLCIALTINAQTKVTEFLGIPVDGTKAEMIEKIKDKGFVLNKQYDWLEGEFNGKEVLVGVNTISNKVWRIGIIDKYSLDEINIKIRFNELCYQFMNNDKYISCEMNSLIDKNENISYNIIVNKKRYEAMFYQKPFDVDMYDRIVWFSIEEHYGEYLIVMFYENKKNKSNGEDL